MTKQTSIISAGLYTNLTEANQLRLNNQYEEAITIYENCISQFNTNVDLLAMAARMLFRFALMNVNETGENYDKAILWLEKALRLEPDNDTIYTQLAEIHTVGTLDYDMAAQEYQNALKINPNNISALWGAASLYGLPEQVVSLDDAIIWMARVIELDPDNPPAYIRLGNLYKEAKRLNDARQAWLKSFLCSQPLEKGDVEHIKRHWQS